LVTESLLKSDVYKFPERSDVICLGPNHTCTSQITSPVDDNFVTLLVFSFTAYTLPDPSTDMAFVIVQNIRYDNDVYDHHVDNGREARIVPGEEADTSTRNVVPLYGAVCVIFVTVFHPAVPVNTIVSAVKDPTLIGSENTAVKNTGILSVGSI
jgi:hypothetical protein